ncbi:hypothetical protein GCM10010489_37030 [Microbacterium saperdae]|nr:hypothetical protein GCM10010489_37030 [Microbacterium saperdae]
MAVDEVRGAGLPWIRVDGTFPLLAEHAGDPKLTHETLDRAPGDVVTVTAEPQPELSGAEHLAVRLPRGEDDRLPPLIRHGLG